MYRYISIVVVGLVTSGTATASTWADGLFDSRLRDFGSVPRGPMISHPFRIVNNTGSPVRISGVRVSCNCVTAQALKTHLAPGEETAVVAQMDTSRFADTRTATIYVTFDQPTSAEVALWVRANSREDVGVHPDALAFGRVKRGSSPEKSAQIALYGSGYAVTGVSCDSNYVRPVVKLLPQADQQVTYELTAKLRPDTPPGRWYTDVWVTTNNPAVPRVRVPLTVEIQSALSVSPGVVLLGTVKSGTEAVRKVIVRGVQPFRIVGVHGTDKSLDVTDTSSESRTVHVLTVTLRPQSSGVVDRTLHVVTDLPEESSIDFTARAHVEP